MQTHYSIVLKEKPLNEGLTKAEIIGLIDMVDDAEYIPVEFQGEYSTAMGFVSLFVSDMMDYDHTNLESYVTSILNDMDNENENNEYEFTVGNQGTNIFSMYLSR